MGDSHITCILSRPGHRGRTVFSAACRCGWASPYLRTFRMALFESDMHVRVEGIKADARYGGRGLDGQTWDETVRS